MDVNNKTKNHCPICKAEKETNNMFCDKHNQAYLELKKGYELWLAAYGILSWDEYLKKLSAIDEIGKFISEVVEYELFFKAPIKKKRK